MLNNLLVLSGVLALVRKSSIRMMQFVQKDSLFVRC